MNEEEIKVKKIEHGTVVDHIPGGKAVRILSILGLNEDFPGTISVIIRVPSARFGTKDIIKVEGKTIAKKELQKLSLIAPSATVNQVRDYKVVEKYRVTVPEEFVDTINCPNSSCITNHEGTAKLLTEERDPLKLRCAYCERVYTVNELSI
mgnify:CR=1 FL=1